MRIVVLTGASGSGKTAIADAIRVEKPGLAEVLHFDRIGVPSPEAMIAGWGSGEAWQRAMTLDWFTRIAAMSSHSRPLLFEGQMRLSFVREGMLANGISNCHIILVDCDDATRARRLTNNRNQAELASPVMMNWAAYLRREAIAAVNEVLDTSDISLEASVAFVWSRLAALS